MSTAFIEIGSLFKKVITSTAFTQLLDFGLKDSGFYGRGLSAGIVRWG